MSTALQKFIELGSFVRLTIDQYHQMIQCGILLEGAPIELLDGLLVWKNRSARGEKWTNPDAGVNLVDSRLRAAQRSLERNGCHLYPLSGAQYQRMIQEGIISEAAEIELLDGLLVRRNRSAKGEK